MKTNNGRTPFSVERTQSLAQPGEGNSENRETSRATRDRFNTSQDCGYLSRNLEPCTEPRIVALARHGSGAARHPVQERLECLGGGNESTELVRIVDAHP